MPDYSVTWSIDIFDADDPREAAERAEAIMRRPIDPEDRLQARVYEVIEQIPPGRGRLADPIVVDLASARSDDGDA